MMGGNKEKGNFISGIVLIVICTLAVLSTVFVKGSEVGESEKAPAAVPLILNDVLTNEMSEIEGLQRLDRNISRYMEEWCIKGAALAVVRNDSLLYAKGYGVSEGDELIQPCTLFRLASVSKLFTAVGIMKLCESGQISLEDKVFTPEGILGSEPYTASIRDSRYFDISVRHLLIHSAGFGSRAGDPMFSTLGVMAQYGLDTPPDHEKLMECILKRRLSYSPGTYSDYSNFGYLILSMIIEKVTGEDYEYWMQENILKPAGCYDMHIGGNYYEQRLKGETRYYAHDGCEKVPCYDGSGIMCERCYGGSDIRNLSGAGAWVASVAELARFVSSIDGRDEVPDIISAESVAEMTAKTDSVTFGIGWTDISEDGTWTRTGTLSGTTALIKVYPDGECWIFVTNTGTWKGPRFAKYTSSMFRRSREEFSSLLPSKNMFYE